jgi:hypothetical protein
VENDEVNRFAELQSGLAGKQQVSQNPPRGELRGIFNMRDTAALCPMEKTNAAYRSRREFSLIHA